MELVEFGKVILTPTRTTVLIYDTASVNKASEGVRMPLIFTLLVGFIAGVLATIWFYDHGGRIAVYGKEYGPPAIASTEAPVVDKNTISVTWPKW